MTALTVGVGLQFKTVAAAVAASHDSDTIYVHAGTYTNDGATINTKISIVGVGGLAHFVSTTPPANGKAIFVTNTDVTFDHVELSGTTVPDDNGAGIRYQGGHLTITNSYFHDNQDGILGGAYSGGTVDIEASEFAHNGAGDGFSHNIYIGAIASLTISNSYIHDAVVGHEIKSRAATTVITNNRIFDNNGTASYSIDLPNGGAGVISGNIIQQGANSQNPAIITFGEEGGVAANPSLQVDGNTVINERTSNPLFVRNSTTAIAAITHNKLFGLTTPQIAQGSNTQTGNTFLSTKPTLDSSHPETASPWDQLFWGGSNLHTGSAGRDLFIGSSGGDTFDGGGGNDRLDAGAGNDILAGGLGRDAMIGGADADSFKFNHKTETPKGAGRDVINDFSGNGLDGDHIDVHSIDAKKGLGNQAFHFIGAKQFHHKAGELHYKVTGDHVLVEGDIDGNGKADFQIEVHNLAGELNTLVKGDFIL